MTLPIIPFLLGLALAGAGQHKTLRYLALGDSYTVGEAVPKVQSFPYQLAKRLREKGFEFADPTVIARTGWTTSELMKGIDEAKPQGKFDLVTLAIGVNNQFRGLPISGYAEEFQTLLNQAIGFTGGKARRVIVLSIPDWGGTPFARGRDRQEIGKQIDAFNLEAEAICKRKAVVFVNVTNISKLAATDPPLVAVDGLHPSETQYEKWVELLLPHVKK